MPVRQSFILDRVFRERHRRPCDMPETDAECLRTNVFRKVANVFVAHQYTDGVLKRPVVRFEPGCLARLAP